jgi:hypothetical protein
MNKESGIFFYLKLQKCGKIRKTWFLKLEDQVQTLPLPPQKKVSQVKTTTKGFLQKEEWANNGDYP